jgi:hypothetical protein
MTGALTTFLFILLTKLKYRKVVKAIPEIVYNQPMPSPTESKVRQNQTKLVEKRKYNIF